MYSPLNCQIYPENFVYIVGVDPISQIYGDTDNAAWNEYFWCESFNSTCKAKLNDKIVGRKTFNF